MTAAAPRPRRSGWTQWARGDGPVQAVRRGSGSEVPRGGLLVGARTAALAGVRAGEAVSAQGPKEEWLDHERIFKILGDAKS